MPFSSYKKFVWLLIGVLPICLIAPVNLSTWNFTGEKLILAQGNDLPFSGEAVQKVSQADLNGDGHAECLNLKYSRLEITDCGNTVFWQSPEPWQVKEAQIGDLNHDGSPEAILLVWRPFRPWPIDTFVPNGGRIKDFHDHDGFSCHVILIGWKRGGYNEVWAGSALIRPVEQLFAVDLDGDGAQELVALEGNYDSMKAGGDLTVWNWDGFGFMLTDEVKQNFQMLNVLHTQQGYKIIAGN